jgi:N-acetylmuramoyl-L-alanine amidase
MNIINHPSPNFDTRGGHVIDMLILHYTGMKTGAEAIERLCNRDTKVSAHYVVEEDGRIFNLVPEDCRAWHAGISSWHGHNNINQRSIGIEIVNPGHEFGYRPFPAAQMKMVAMLCRDILHRHRTIPDRNVIGHSDIAPTRKQDPGELFDWKTLAGLGIGLWPQTLSITSCQLPENKSYELQASSNLSSYGYDTTDPQKTITAFQRHFRPTLINGLWDDECAGLLAGLLAIL